MFMDPVGSSRLLQKSPKSKIIQEFCRNPKNKNPKTKKESPGPPGLLLDPKVLPVSQIFF
jgi:hypothetical protein